MIADRFTRLLLIHALSALMVTPALSAPPGEADPEVRPSVADEDRPPPAAKPKPSPAPSEKAPPEKAPADKKATEQGAAKKDAEKEAAEKKAATKKAAKKRSGQKATKRSAKRSKRRSSKRRSRRSKRSKKQRGAKACDYLSPIHNHEVIQGEILGEIAGRYGVTITDLKRLNPRDLKNPDRIFPGMKLAVCPAIPPRERLREDYIIRRGDTLSKIAKRFDLTVDEVVGFQARGFSTKSMLRVGDKLIIWRDGDVLAAFAPPDQDKGSLKMSYRLRTSGHYHIKRPHRSFGTRSTVQLLYKVLNAYRRKYKGPTLVVGDLSKKGGGKISGHVSHQTGMDVDLGFVHTKKAGKLKDFIRVRDNNLDVKRTWGLVHEFLKTNQIRYMFIDYDVQKELYEYARKHGVSKNKLSQWFQYPRSKRRAYGIVRHWKNHDDHIHVRFRK